MPTTSSPSISRHRRAVFVGTFDPPTMGHLDLIRRAAALVDELVIGVLVNADKRPMFSDDERVSMLRAAMPSPGSVRVERFEGLLVDFVARVQADFVVRGLRTSVDLAEEAQMAMMNRHLSAACETLFLIPDAKFSFISSRWVRDVIRHGGPLDGLVPLAVIDRIRTRADSRP